MIKRVQTKKIYVGNVAVGGDAPITTQSMTYSQTADVDSTVEQIKRLHFAGCDIVRCAVPNMEDALALKSIKEQIELPLVADIHFNHKLALVAAEVVDCIRINPGNIGSKEKVNEVIKAAKDYNCSIRIGVNGGSLEKKILEKYSEPNPQAKLDHVVNNIKILEEYIDSIEDAFKTLRDIKTNFIIKVLALFSALLLPLTLITSFYGMNIELPFSDTPVFVFLFLSLSAIAMIIIYFVFKRN